MHGIRSIRTVFKSCLRIEKGDFKAYATLSDLKTFFLYEVKFHLRSSPFSALANLVGPGRLSESYHGIIKVKTDIF